MRAFFRGGRPLVGLGVLAAVAAGLFLGAGRAAAEAPFFYDSIALHSTYDPDFNPMNRHAGLVALLVQGWSYPDAGTPRQSIFDQNYAAEYRFQWWATLDPRYSLLVELKADSRDLTVGEDYFLKTELVFQNVKAPLWVYTGMRVPEKTDFMVYGGVETMSFKLQDMLRNVDYDMPLAFRGFAELRYDLDDDDPTLRLMGLGHTLPEWGVPNLTLTAGLDTFFNTSRAPVWMLEGHAEYEMVPPGFARLSVLAGYGIDLRASGEQRFSIGARLGLF